MIDGKDFVYVENEDGEEDLDFYSCTLECLKLNKCTALEFHPQFKDISKRCKHYLVPININHSLHKSQKYHINDGSGYHYSCSFKTDYIIR